MGGGHNREFQEALENNLGHYDCMSLDERVRNIATDVYNQLGSGHSEVAYQNAMEVGLRTAGITFEAQKVIELKYKDCYIGEEYLDLLARNEQESLVIEIKVSGALGIPEEQQLRNYMKQVGISRGLLINFPQPSRNDVADCSPEFRSIDLASPLIAHSQKIKKAAATT